MHPIPQAICKQLLSEFVGRSYPPLLAHLRTGQRPEYGQANPKIVQATTNWPQADYVSLSNQRSSPNQGWLRNCSLSKFQFLLSSRQGGLMPKLERVREAVRMSPTLEYFAQKAQEGWKLVAVEWQREVEGEEEAPPTPVEEVPYGLRVSEDCLHLQEDPAEKQTLTLMMELLLRDLSFSGVAEELNQHGFRSRDGRRWTTISVFNLLPRLIEMGPRIFASEEWAERRKHLVAVAWGS
jgi:hypothetical protein